MGNFKNAGSVWAQTPQAVNDHDFRSQADAKAAASPAKEDPEAGLEFTPPAVAAAEGASGAYTVHLSSEPTAPVTVTLTQPTNTDVRVDTDPSTGGNQNTLSFTPANWSTPQRVTVSVDEDDDAVNEEATIGHAASGTEAYEGVSGEVEVGVKDNDAPGLVFSPISVTEPEGSTYTYSVKLTAQPTAPVTVTLTQPANTDVTVDTDPSAPRNQRVVTFTTDNWYAPQTVTVMADANADAAQDTATIAHAASGAPEYEGFDENLSVTVNDDTTFVRSSKSWNGISRCCWYSWCWGCWSAGRWCGQRRAGGSPSSPAWRSCS